MTTIGFVRVRTDEQDLATQRPLLLAIYSYFAQSEREFISIRTKQGLAAVKTRGTKWGRPAGSRNKERPLDPHREQIRVDLQANLDIASIRNHINPHLSSRCPDRLKPANSLAQG